MACPGFEFAAETRAQEVVFGADADFGAGDVDDRTGDERRPAADEESHGKQHGEHSSVYRMANDRIGAGADQLMVGVEGGIETPLFAEMADCKTGGQDSGESKENAQ